jgi:hypothetical protein
MVRNINAVDYGSYTITGTAGKFLSFADSGSPSTMPKGALSYKGRVETASFRARDDGTNPTASEGELKEVGDDVIFDSSMLDHGVYIRTGSTSAVVKGHFYNVEASVLLGAN